MWRRAGGWLLATIPMIACDLLPPPAPRIASVTPPVIVAGRSARVTVRGARFRVPLDVTIGSVRRPLYVSTNTIGEFDVSDLEPGRYDIALIDGGREVQRLERAVTIDRPSPATAGPAGTWAVQIVGTFEHVPRATARRIAAAAAGGESATGVEVLRAGDASPSVRDVATHAFGVFRVPVPDAIDLKAIVRMRLNASCAEASVARIASGIQPLCVRPDGRAAHCNPFALGCRADELTVLEGALLPVRLDHATSATLRVQRLRAADAVAQFNDDRVMHVAATIIDPADRTDTAFGPGAAIFESDGTGFGRVIARKPPSAGDDQGTIRLAISVRCTAVDGGCRRGLQLVAPGVILPVRVEKQTATLRIDDLRPIDEPLLYAR